MSKKSLFLISSVLVLGLVCVSYGEPNEIWLDFDSLDVNDDVNTQPGFTSFLFSTDNGSTVNDITIDILPDNLDQTAPAMVRTKLNDKPQDWHDWGVGVELYPDLVYARHPSGLNITLWELGAGQTCQLTIWIYDNQSDHLRQADWYANGVYAFRSEFTGGESWPNCMENPCDWGPPTYAYDINVIADALGRIALNCVRGPNSFANQPFAFACGLRVIPETYTAATTYAHRPLPYNDEINLPVTTDLKWRKGSTAATRDVYLGTSFGDVNTATRANPKGVLIATAQGPNNIDPYGATGHLKMNRTYYWRVDEVISGTPQKGEVWNFKTAPSHVMEDWSSYATSDDLKDIWKDYTTQEEPVTNAESYIDMVIVRSDNSMRYEFENDYYLGPYYSEVRANTADIGMDPNWIGMDAASLSVWFYGDATNPTTEPMYMILKDSSANTASVEYSGDINDLKVESWQEWNIPLSSFTDANASLNLKNVSKIIIRFGDPNGPVGNNGTAYFDDLRLYPIRCVLAERGSDFSTVDYFPGGSPAGDCVIDLQELDLMASTWLAEDVCLPASNPGMTGLVGYWSMDEGDGNRIYPTAYDANLGIDPNNLIGWMDPCDEVGISSGAISWTTGVPMQDCNGCAWDEGSALHFDGQDGIRVEFGPAYALDPNDVNNFNPAAPNGQLSLAIWAKWLGRHLDKDKCQGMISKRREWAANVNGVMFMFECDTIGEEPRGTFGIRQFNAADTDVFAAEHMLTGFINQWAHMAVTFDGTTARLYFNGSEVANGPFYFGTAEPNNVGLTIGNVNCNEGWPNGPESFKGTLDEAYIFNRALTPEEVAYLSDQTPWDGVKTVPVPSAAEIYTGEPEGERVVNFKDFAMVADIWLEEDMYP